MNNDQNIASQLHEMLTDLVENERFPGLAVGIASDNKILLAGEYGTANVLTGAPVVRRSLFHQASVSKTFVATAIMQLVERGKVDLDSPIINYLTYFKLADEQYRNITVRQLMNHTSGMPDEDDYAWERPEYDEQSLERYVKGIAHRKLLSDPGEKFAYSNIGYEILGDMIAKVSGMSFEHYMKTNILEPTGMRSSSFLKQEVEAHLAAPHVLGTSEGYGGYVSDVFPYNRAHGPSSTLYTNAEDMCHYLMAHQNRGTSFNGYELLNSGSYDEMWKPHAATGYGEVNAKIGLGWFLGEYKASLIISHTGWDTGFLSKLFLLPDKKIAISIMTNGDFVWLDNVCSTILDLLLGSDIRVIRRSLAHKLAALVVSDGVEKTIAAYHRIQSEELDTYYLAEHEFMGIADRLRWTDHKEDAIRILICASTLFPENSDIAGKVQEFQAMA